MHGQQNVKTNRPITTLTPEASEEAQTKALAQMFTTCRLFYTQCE